MFDRIKKIDKLMVKSFIPPFILAFFIALFVLVMQFLWKFIDEIIGKGIGMIDLGELLFYRSLTLLPMALPIGVLLASVMVMGNLSEKYELASLKSAGVSLTRVMRGMLAMSILVSIFSFYCSNSLIPISNLKFYSRLYSIRSQKPALSIEERVFNEDFRGYSIRVGKKLKDNKNIEDILIYDDTPSKRGQINLVSAKRGEMYISPDESYFVMKLYDGYQYSELNRNPGDQSPNPFVRTEFREWEKQFDLSEFDLNQTDEELFKSHHYMKSVSQLLHEIDTMNTKLVKLRSRNQYDFGKTLKSIKIKRDTMSTDEMYKSMSGAQLEGKPPKEAVSTSTKPGQVKNRRPIQTTAIERLLDTISIDTQYHSFAETVPPAELRKWAVKAQSTSNSLESNIGRTETMISSLKNNRKNYIRELHTKFSIAMVCIIFLFIGAPMGAIVRKGGFGYPLLISIMFFTLFILLTIMCRKLVDTNSIGPILGAWLPCIILGPIGIFITIKAMNDDKVLNIDAYAKPIIKLFSRKKKQSVIT